MASRTINGVIISPLRQIPDELGVVMHMLRCDSPTFEGFGEIYFSCIKPGAVKAWRCHRKMICNFAVPSGEVQIVLYDARPSSSTRGCLQDIVVGEEHYVGVRIPAGVWYGFRGRGSRESLIANCATLPHDPDEIQRLPASSQEIPWTWQGE